MKPCVICGIDKEVHWEIPGDHDWTDVVPNKPSLNTIRIPVSVLRTLTVELVQHNIDDIGLEDLIVSLRARVRHNDVDNT